MNPEFLNIQEISEYLGIKPSTVYSMVEARAILHYKVGRLIRFQKSEIEQWMLENKRECVPAGKMAPRFLKNIESKSKLGRIIKKSIESAKREQYNIPNGKPDQVKGLGKEAKHGSV